MKLPAYLSSDPRRNPLGYTVLALILLYGALLANPSRLFAQTLHAGAITLYTHDSPAGLDRDLALAQRILARSPIDDPALPQRFYLTHTPAQFALYTNVSRFAFGVTHAQFSDTFVAPSDAASDIVRSARATFNERPLSAVLAHERTHLLLAHHFGRVSTMLSPAWKQEGYCDYIAGGPSVGDDATGFRLLASPATSSEPAVLYFRDSLRVRYLIEVEHLG